MFCVLVWMCDRSWSYRWLLATLFVLDIELRDSERAERASVGDYSKEP